MEFGVGEIFWLLILLVLFLPWFRQKALDRRRTRLLRKLEDERQSRVILLVHRQETLALFGLPLFRFIDINDAEEVIRAIRLTDPDTPIDLVLHTPGGLAIACMQIARAVQKHRARVSVLVPYHALSGGTLIALAADEIIMDTHAVLGPVDPQIGQFPAASVVKVPHIKHINRVDDSTLIHADVAEKALNQMRQEVIELLADKKPAEKASELADRLSQGYWTHDHPIGFRQAQELGLNLNPEFPDEFYELMRLFPQPTRRRPSVEYVPIPYERRERRDREEESRPKSSQD